MPYSSISELPKNVSMLPASAKRVFMTAYNNAGSDVDNKSAYAWGAVKKNWRKKGGKWVKKAGSTMELDPQRIASISASRLRALVATQLRVAFVEPAARCFNETMSFGTEMTWITPIVSIRMASSLSSMLKDADNPNRVSREIKSLNSYLLHVCTQAKVAHASGVAKALSLAVAACAADQLYVTDPQVTDALKMCADAKSEIRYYQDFM